MYELTLKTNILACVNSELPTLTINDYELLRVQVILKTCANYVSDDIDCGPPPSPPKARLVSNGIKYTASYMCVDGGKSKSGETVETISCSNEGWTPATDICEGSFFLLL